MITLTLEETQQVLSVLEYAGPSWIDGRRYAAEIIRSKLSKPLDEPWVKTYSGGKPNYTQPCERCGEVNPAEIHTCTPIENLTS